MSALPKKRTSSASASMSAKCHKQTKKNQATDPLSTRYLPLDQITKDNFKDLKVTWRWKPAIGPAPVGHPFRSASSAEASGGWSPNFHAISGTLSFPGRVQAVGVGGGNRAPARKTPVAEVVINYHHAECHKQTCGIHTRVSRYHQAGSVKNDSGMPTPSMSVRNGGSRS